MPHGLSKIDLIGFRSGSSKTGDELDLRIPSVSKIAAIIRQAFSTQGLGVVAGQAPWLYAYGND